MVQVMQRTLKCKNGYTIEIVPDKRYGFDVYRHEVIDTNGKRVAIQRTPIARYEECVEMGSKAVSMLSRMKTDGNEVKEGSKIHDNRAKQKNIKEIDIYELAERMVGMYQDIASKKEIEALIAANKIIRTDKIVLKLCEDDYVELYLTGQAEDDQTIAIVKAGNTHVRLTGKLKTQARKNIEESTGIRLCNSNMYCYKSIQGIDDLWEFTGLYGITCRRELKQYGITKKYGVYQRN